MCNKDIEKATKSVNLEIQTLYSSNVDINNNIDSLEVLKQIEGLKLAESLLMELKMHRAEKRGEIILVGGM